MAEDGQRVRLVHAGSTFTDSGEMVAFGDAGFVLGHKGMDTLVVHWERQDEVGTVAARSVTTVEYRTKGRR